MQKIFILSTLFSFALASVFFVGCGGKATKTSNDEVVAEFEWNGKHHTVTLGEMQQEISELPKYKQDDYEGEKQTEYLTLMAESRLLLLIAQDRKLDEDPEIAKKVDEYLHQLMVEEITEREVDNRVKFSEEELNQYYEEHKADYIDPEKVRVTCATVDDEEQSQKIFEEIQGGKDIAEVAKGLSEEKKNVGPGGGNNGDTGLFSRNSFSVAKDFVEAAFEMKVGEMTEEVLEQDVEGPGGTTTYYMIFRKEEHKPERQKEFDEEDVRKDVEREVERAQKEQRMNEWLESLKTKAKLKMYTDKIVVTSEEKEEPEEEKEEKVEEAQTPEAEEAQTPETQNAEGEQESPESETTEEGKTQSSEDAPSKDM